MSDVTGRARVKLLSVYANLPLEGDREQAVADILDAWVVDANALSLKMSAIEHQDISPVTVFISPVGFREDG